MTNTDGDIVAELPWGGGKLLPASVAKASTVPPGHYAAQTLLGELFHLCDKKLAEVAPDDQKQKYNLVRQTVQINMKRRFRRQSINNSVEATTPPSTRA